MPVHKIVSSPDTIEIWRTSSGPTVSLNRADYRGSQAEIESAVLADLQAALDTIQERSLLPADDNDKTEDPTTDKEFWEGTTIRSRSVLVVSVVWPNKSDCIVTLTKVF